jgi:ATP-binding cassette, subfamily F, member 3
MLLQVVVVEGLTHSYSGAKPLFQDAALVAERGQRIAFLGPNGAGKSTLLRLIMGIEQPSHGGQARFGPSVMANYFQQV